MVEVTNELEVLTETHPVQRHVVFGHQIGDYDTGGPGESHVAVDHHQASPGHCSVDVVRRPVEIPGASCLATAR